MQSDSAAPWLTACVSVPCSNHSREVLGFPAWAALGACAQAPQDAACRGCEVPLHSPSLLLQSGSAAPLDLGRGESCFLDRPMLASDAGELGSDWPVASAACLNQGPGDVASDGARDQSQLPSQAGYKPKPRITGEQP